MSTITYKIYEFNIKLHDGKQKSVRMSAEATISCPVQLIPINAETDPIFSSVKLAEPLVQQPTMVSIDILIGADYYYEFIGQEQVRCANGLVLLSSLFGYVVGGSLKTYVSYEKLEPSLLIHQPSSRLQSMEQFWSLEDIGIKGDYDTTDDDVALQFFNKTTEYKTGRYFVKWPWKADFPELPDNFGLALGRLNSLLKRLHQHKQILHMYNDTILAQKEKGIVEEAPLSPEGKLHYLPHHHVVTPTKATTKLRIVYDGSAKASRNSVSLNECLHRGPVFLADSVGIILRMRLHTVAFVSDIEKAFLQVGLQTADRDVTRFLWVMEIDQPASSKNLQTYRFCRVPFGIISSPFLLAATISYHLQASNHIFSKTILDNVYVDNVFNGCQTPEAAVEFYKEAKHVFSTASMNLREWYSNSEVFSNTIPSDDKGNGSSTTILGLKWDLPSDALYVCAKPFRQLTQRPTKRCILQNIASVFDPCGFFAPITITGKILMQQLWKDNIDWDTPVASKIRHHWNALAEDLQSIPSFPIPRKLPLEVGDANSSIELHCFTDASAKAYSAAVYIRTVTNFEAKTALVIAKSRVAPIRPLSVPRLELMAALIGSRLLRFVIEQLKIQFDKIFLWTDSTCILTWILSKRVKTVFVQHRIREICSLKDVIYRYVHTSENPADIPSRGTSFKFLQSSTLWWQGERWLAQSLDNWPADLKLNSETLELDEKDTSSSCLQLCSTNIETNPTIGSPLLLNLDSYSSLQKVYRGTAYIVRFVCALRRQLPVKPSLGASELEQSRLFWTGEIQKQYFHDIISRKPNTTSKTLIQNLGVFVDSDGLLRCKGRYIDATSQHTYPILLPKRCRFSDLLIMDCHQRLFHSGVRHTLAETRQRYWIVHGRSEIKRVLRDCKLCRRYHGGPFKIPDPPPLPRFRTCQQRPFETTGLDYMGPLLISNEQENSTQKVWICLFTCAVIRAVHLEVVQDQSSAQFLLCLRRFIATFGHPRLIVSDNAAQFHTTEKCMRKIWQDIIESRDVQSQSSQHGLSWKFITELAPWMGGFYERMIGIVKTSLKKTIHRRSLNLVELQTLLCEIGSVINSRPLLYSEETVEGGCLTPAHFIFRSTEHFPSVSADNEYVPEYTSGRHLIIKWRRMQALLNNFWKSWKTSYLQGLQDHIWKPKLRNVSQFQPDVGTVVLVKDSCNRANWRYAKIVKLLQSHDNKCRSALVRLASGTLLRRAIKHLYPLEYSEESSDVTKLIQENDAPYRQLPVRRTAARARKKIRAAIRNSADEEIEDF